MSSKRRRALPEGALIYGPEDIPINEYSLEAGERFIRERKYRKYRLRVLIAVLAWRWIRGYRCRPGG